MMYGHEITGIGGTPTSSSSYATRDGAGQTCRPNDHLSDSPRAELGFISIVPAIVARCAKRVV